MGWPVYGTQRPSLARPGGNLTGLMPYEEGITGKWLALLKEIAPGAACPRDELIE